MRIRIEDNFDNEYLENLRIVVTDGEKNSENINNSVEQATIIDTRYEEVQVPAEEKMLEIENDNENMKKNYKPTIDNLNGKIVVYSRLMNKNGSLISSAKINLYMLKGLSPRYIATQYTDKNGCAVFTNLKKGSYRIIAIVDRVHFEKPTYIEWNEVTIDSNNKQATITVINKIKTDTKR